MKTSTAAIDERVDVLVLGFPAWARLGAVSDVQEGIRAEIDIAAPCQGFKPRGRFAPMGKHQLFTPGDASQDTLRVLTKLKHGYGFHWLEV